MSQAHSYGKLSAVLQKHPPLFADAVSSFEEAYPSVAKLRVEVSERGIGGFNKVRKNTRLTEDDFRRVIDCSNPACCGGGIEIDKILKDVVLKNETHRECTEHCCGCEGKIRNRKCLHFFDVKIDVEYKPKANA